MVPSHCVYVNVYYSSVPGPCDPEDLLEGVIFGAKYLGSTQLKSEKNPSTSARMAQAQEAVDRIKVFFPQQICFLGIFCTENTLKLLSSE